MLFYAFGIQHAYLYIALLVMLYAVLAIIAILTTPDTKGKDLETS